MMRRDTRIAGLDLLLRDAEVDGRITRIHIRRGRIAAIGPDLVVPRADVLEVADCAVIPGLHDHHVHIAALAAALTSVTVGPPVVHSESELRSALASAAAVPRDDGWIRAVGYHESVAGMLDRHNIDEMVRGCPVRVQYRTGTMWILNTVAIERLGLASLQHPGVERDEQGNPTGRVIGADDLLRKLGGWGSPNIRRATDLLLSFGVTGVTDATPFEDNSSAELIEHIRAPAPRIVVTGGPSLVYKAGRGPVKLIVADHALPSLDAITMGIRAARAQRRAVAVHCVSRIGLLLALAAWEEVGVLDGDRIEHGGIIDVAMLSQLVDLGLTVVTQPNFIAERGDQYLKDVESDDLPHLYRCGSLLAAGVRVAGGTDAPFGNPDPWRAMAAAVDRTTSEGVVLGPQERVTRARALDLFLGPLHDPGGPRRTLFVGAPADLCVLDAAMGDVLRDLAACRVCATIVDGRIAYAK